MGKFLAQRVKTTERVRKVLAANAKAKKLQVPPTNRRGRPGG
jgi:hypothetical protein